MEEKVNILVIGGSAAGLVAAMTAKGSHKDQRVMMIRKEEKVMIPCGIPYIFGSLEGSDQNILPDAGLIGLGVEIIIDSVISVDTEKHLAKTEKGLEVSYDRLIMATGSTPIKPGWLKGKDLDQVYVIPKDKVYLDNLLASIQDKKHIVVVGAGFIGVEVSDELAKRGHEVTLVEKEPHILGMAFDQDVAIEAEEILKNNHVKIVTGVGISAIIGEKSVSGVQLADGQTIGCEAVILSMGYVPNSQLAKQSGIPINDKGFILVDEYMRTPVKDVYAAGDCAEKRDFTTNKIATTMLASTACAEARVAAFNLYQLSTIKKFKGTIGIYSTCIGNTAFGVAGLTEAGAKKEGFAVVTGKFQGIDRHPGKLANAHKQSVKLVASQDSGRILGGAVVGGSSAGEITNIIGFIIQSGLTIADLLVAQIGTQPMLTASPAAYPLIKAAEITAKLL